MAHHTYDRGGSAGTLSVSLDEFYGSETVLVELPDGATFANLTAATARELAHDLLAHADRLDPPKLHITGLGTGLSPTMAGGMPPMPSSPTGPGLNAAAWFEAGRRQGRHERGGYPP